MTETTITIDKDIEHETTNFVDNSGSIIAFGNKENSQIYLQRFIKILETHYNIKKLCINSKKTALLIFKPDNKDKYMIKTKDNENITSEISEDTRMDHHKEFKHGETFREHNKFSQLEDPKDEQVPKVHEFRHKKKVI